MPLDRRAQAQDSPPPRFPDARRHFALGLGQDQNGAFNYRDSLVELGQANTDVAVPLLVSTNGYGIF